MDDQNKNNQPLVSSNAPLTPSVPEDITPTDPAPLPTPETPPSVQNEVPSMDPISEPAPEAEPELPPEPEVVPMPAPSSTPTPPELVEPQINDVPVAPIMDSTPEMAPMPESDAVPMPTPSVEPETSAPVADAEMPAGKPKNKLMPIIGGVVALFLVIGIAGAAYFVSDQLSTRQAVAPNAPTSNPLAAEECDSSSSTHPACRGKNVGDEVCYLTTASLICTRSTGTLCSGEFGGSACSISGGGGGGSCTPSGSSSGCNYVDNVGSTGPAGSPCDPSNWANDACTSFTFKCGTRCYVSNCGASACTALTPTCDESKRDPKSNTVTFPSAGTVSMYSRTGTAGTVTLTGPKTVTIPMPTTGNAVQQTTKFQVAAGETYTIKVRLATENKDAYGWRTTKATNKCGPSNTVCGNADADITALANLATANSSSIASTQCWGDAELGDATQDYDYDDFTLIFGYEKAAARTWNVTTKGVCPSGTVPKVPLRMFRIIWPQVGDGRIDWDVKCEPFGDSTEHTMSIASTHAGTVQSIYVGVETATTNGVATACSDGVAFQPVSIVPNVPISSSTPATGDFVSFAKYFNPLTWMARWNHDRLAAGNVSINYTIPAEFCEAATCVPTDVLTCNPDCPTACGQPSSQISCTNSCNETVSKSCPATAACPVVGACVEIKIYKSAANGTYPTTPLTAAQLQNLKVGDKLKFSVKGNVSNLGAQFRVHINGTPGNWLQAPTLTSSLTSSYSDYVVAVPGSYKFEAQVTTAPSGVTGAQLDDSRETTQPISVDGGGVSGAIGGSRENTIQPIGTVDQ